MQQINLYLSLRRPGRYAVNFDRFWKISAALIGVLLLITILQVLGLIYDRTHTKQLQAKQLWFAQMSTKLEASSPNVRAAMKIQQNINDINAIFAQLSLVRQTIQQNSPYSISPYLLALAKAITPGIWITSINIQDHGRNITIKGNVLDPILMPKFMKTLGQQPVFIANPINNFKISHQPNVGYADFVLGVS